ncbi:AI-2E family transporter [Micromonospora musae]|uniref:AI-2E family transporter n=1 Tax=Micromonospora musae TaxID=1894970 RepID=UPI00343CA6E2
MRDADDRRTARRALVVIGLLLGTTLALAFLWSTRRILIWAVIAAFFAVALKPLVDLVQRRLLRRRALATLLVFTITFVVLAALAALIVVPLVDDLVRFTERAPELLREARAGRGVVGRTLDRIGLRDYLANHSDQIRQYGERLRQPAVGVIRGVAEGVFGLTTVIVLAYLMVLEAPRMIRTTLSAAGAARGERWQRIGREVSRTVTGYLTGNLVISLICGLATFLVLLLAGVPFAAVIALLVAIADLIPLVGATIGAIIAIGAAFLHSTTAGIIVLVFFVIYQQIENHLLQPVILARSVRLNPLTVLISVLLAAELAGLVGALLAIPAAGIVRILLREYLPLRRVPPEPTRPEG